MIIKYTDHEPDGMHLDFCGFGGNQEEARERYRAHMGHEPRILYNINGFWYATMDTNAPAEIPGGLLRNAIDHLEARGVNVELELTGYGQRKLCDTLNKNEGGDLANELAVNAEVRVDENESGG